MAISFKSLNENDLPLLVRWLSEPHVFDWWNDGLTDVEIIAKYRERIGDEIVCPFIVYVDETPIGFIQYYWASKVGEEWWANEVETTVGLDQFIGEIDFINKGYGTEMLKAFIRLLFITHPQIKKIITEADPQNFRAQRCYEKVGFQKQGIIDTPGGKSILYQMLL